MARKSRQSSQQASAAGILVPALDAIQEAKPVRYKVGIYARLSVYDLGRDNSDTMDNQIALLQQYVAQQTDLVLADVYIDNGWTGTNFTRPEFKRLLQDAQKGRINCIVVKDLSRFGRNYLESGYYIQKMFPLYHVRFISITDGFDSLTSDPDSMAISMKNIVNDYYSKDISRKVSSSLDIKRTQGTYSWGHPVYGYVRNKENPAQLEIDDEVAPYVHLMFQWAMDGMPLYRIADTLTQLQAPTYQRLANIRNNGHTKRKGSDTWSYSSVMQIVTNQVYAGDFVCNKSYFRKYDPANARWLPEDEWVIIPDTHTPYIDREDFFLLKDQILNHRKENAQRVKDKEALRARYPDKFQGLLFCGACNRHMGVRRDFRNGLYMAYQCVGYENQFHRGHERFTMEAQTLELAVLWQLNLQIKAAIDAETFLRRLSLQDTAKQLKTRRQADVNMLKSKAAKLKKRRSGAFEDLSAGLIDEGVYHIQMEKLAAELAAVTDMIKEAERRRDSVDEYFTLDNQWLRAFVETGAVNEMTPELIRHLIKRIDVCPDKRIRITFNYANWMEPLMDCVEEVKSQGGAPSK